MIVGVTGHQRLDDESAWTWVEEAVRAILAALPRPLAGLSSLAIGADQIFARLVLEQGGELRAVLPFPAYVETFEPGDDRDRYQALLARAASVEVLPARASAEESYLKAGQRVVRLADRMIAVWNGRKAAGPGGTGDIVRYALGIGKEVLHVDPVRRETRNLFGVSSAPGS